MLYHANFYYETLGFLNHYSLFHIYHNRLQFPVWSVECYLTIVILICCFAHILQVSALKVFLRIIYRRICFQEKLNEDFSFVCCAMLTFIMVAWEYLIIIAFPTFITIMFKFPVWSVECYLTLFILVSWFAHILQSSTKFNNIATQTVIVFLSVSTYLFHGLFSKRGWRGMD